MADYKPDIGVFCVRCFASDKNSSWGDQATPGHCYNCGGGGCTVAIPEWAIESIREQASWVGKRYYPNDEDKRLSAELRHLRAQMPMPPGRHARRLEDSRPNEWVVSQREAGVETMVLITADSEEEALRLAAPRLPYPLDTSPVPWVPTPTL